MTTPATGDCGKDKFGCYDAEGDHRFRCHREFRLCDGKKDCLDGKDEELCGKTLSFFEGFPRSHQNLSAVLNLKKILSLVICMYMHVYVWSLKVCDVLQVAMSTGLT